GQAGIQRAVMGSVAERLLSRSDVPIIMLRPAGRRMDRIADLLVPLDGTPGGAFALASGLQLAKTTGAKIRLIEVVVPLKFDALDPGEYDPAWDDEALNAARTYVTGMANQVHAAGVEADGDARLGADIAASIVRSADEHASDMIVMS